MEHFIIDTQTFNDLEIFTAKAGSSSIYDLFKHTRTLAARKRLITIMESPSNNLGDIILRRDAIKYFYDHQICLQIKNEVIDLVDFYLKSKFPAFKNNPLDALADYAKRNSSNDYYVIKTGQRYLIQLSRYLLEFIAQYNRESAPPYLHSIFDQITGIIVNGVLSKATLLDEKRLSFSDITRLDRALRGAEKENINLLLELVYELDIFENIALVAAAKDFSFPEFTTSAGIRLNIEGLFHPAIKNAVRNNIGLGEQQNLMFLTGSNMAGKSSLLKSLGLIVYLAHLGFPVPAAAVELTVSNGLVTTINLPDNINQGLSHYYTEVKRVKEVAEHLLEHDRMFVIFDELFRGTNVKDAFDGSSLIISELSTIKTAAFIISTHIVELAAELQQFSNISFQYMDTYFEHQAPVFTYKLMEGISKEALGMYIVRNEGIVEILQKAAKLTNKRQLANSSLTEQLDY